MSGPVTLGTLAQRSGFHISTVSRALHDDARTRGRISAETVRSIRSLAAELGYQRNRSGAALRTGRSQAIGVLVPRLTDVVLATIYEGIDAAAARRGFDTVVANSGDDPEAQRRRTEALLARQVDGLILGDAHIGSHLARGLVTRGVPVVLVSRRLPRHVSVTTDDLLGGRLAGDHLASLGHTTVGVVGGEDYASTSLERRAGFVEAYTAHDLHVSPSYIVTSSFDASGGRQAAKYLLGLRPMPTAIFAVNDFAAIGAMGAVREAGLRVGVDVAIIGYNDLSIAQDLPVPLTSIRTKMHEMGEVAAETVLAMIDGKRVRSRRIRPELVARESTGPIPLAPPAQSDDS